MQNLEAFRDFTEMTLKVYLRMESKKQCFLTKIYVFSCEHADSAIGVSNSLEGFRGFAEFTLKVYLRVESKTH